MFSGKDIRQGQAAPKPKQAATQRRDGDGAACPQLENWDGESHSVYPSARIYRNMRLHETCQQNSKHACFSIKPCLNEIQSELLCP
jgi:hypothetical protein